MTDCKTVLLDDVPSVDDAFSSNGEEGPHQRVARAIIGMIEDESGGKVVGLEGGWGSGKSTVVNLVRLHFVGQTSISVIPFDAWAHEGDPLRRTFLECVIRDLQDKEWVDRNRWKKKRKRIAHKKRDTKSTTRTKPTLLGKIFAVSAIVVPFGTSLVADALRDGVTIAWGAPAALQFLFGTALSLAPLAVLLSNLALAKARGRSVSWAFLSQNETTSLTTTTELPNPTSIEFEEYFSELLDEALDDQYPDRRLVLVVDNLDRVDSASALSIWSTLQTFLQDRRLRTESWFQRVWVIVPFDPSALRKLWDRFASAQDGQTEAQTEDRSEVSDSFFDKSFQIRFYIAPPVISDWRAYLEDLLQKALPDHDEDDRHLVYRVYAHCRRAQVNPPTPRELKLFVNQIGAILRQWGREVPIGHVAYFVLEHRKSDKLLNRLRRGEVPTSDDSRLFESGALTDSLAGLIFNVRPVKGRELLLGELIRQALLEDGDLNEIAESHPEGFWPVFETVVQAELIGANAQHLGRAAIKLRDSRLLEANRYEVKTAMSSLGKGVEGITSVGPWDEPMANGVAALCELLKDEAKSHRLFGGVGAVLATQAKPPLEPEVIVQSLTTILDVADALGHQHHCPKRFASSWTRRGGEVQASSLVR